LNYEIAHIEIDYFYMIQSSLVRDTKMKSAVAILLCLTYRAVGETIELNVPATPPNGVQILDAAFQGYSMELASFPDIAGNLRWVIPILEPFCVNDSSASQTSSPSGCYRI
jgi:hypothetical protein